MEKTLKKNLTHRIKSSWWNEEQFTAVFNTVNIRTKTSVSPKTRLSFCCLQLQAYRHKCFAWSSAINKLNKTK